MTTEYSVSVDDWTYSSWEFTGRNVMSEYYTNNPQKAKDEGYELDEKGEVRYLDELVDAMTTPMMLYAYPLRGEPSDEAIVKICIETNCTVVMKKDTEEYYLALTGGGMNLSQDIALAYILAENRIPPALASGVSTHHGLSQCGENWVKVMEYCKKAVDRIEAQYREDSMRITEALDRYDETQKQHTEGGGN